MAALFLAARTKTDASFYKGFRLLFPIAIAYGRWYDINTDEFRRGWHWWSIAPRIEFAHHGIRLQLDWGPIAMKSTKVHQSKPATVHTIG